MSSVIIPCAVWSACAAAAKPDYWTDRSSKRKQDAALARSEPAPGSAELSNFVPRRIAKSTEMYGFLVRQP